MRPLRLAVVCGLFAALPAGAGAPELDALERFRIEPVLAQYYAEQLGLSGEQKAFVAAQLEEAAQRFKALRGELDRELRATEAMLSGPPPNEDQLLAQLDRVLDVERRIKRSNLASALRVRRHLTPAQLEQLKLMPIPPPPPPPRPGAATKTR